MPNYWLRHSGTTSGLFKYTGPTGNSTYDTGTSIDARDSTGSLLITSRAAFHEYENIGGASAAPYISDNGTVVMQGDLTLSGNLTNRGKMLWDGARRDGLLSIQKPNSPYGITLQPPVGLNANYSLILPSGVPINLPANSTALLTADASGNVYMGDRQAGDGGKTTACVSGILAVSGLQLGSFQSTGIVAPQGAAITLYQDSVSKNLSVLNSLGNPYPVRMSVSTLAAIASFNTTETIVAGGALGGTNTPNTSFQVPASTFQKGSTIRCKISGTCTSTVANTTTVRFRVGSAGTLADPIAFSFPITAAASGSNSYFSIEFIITFISTGATPNVNYMVHVLSNGGIGISNVVALSQNLAVQAWAATTLSAAYVTVSLQSSAITTTYTTLPIGFMELL